MAPIRGAIQDARSLYFVEAAFRSALFAPRMVLRGGPLLGVWSAGACSRFCDAIGFSRSIQLAALCHL